MYFLLRLVVLLVAISFSSSVQLAIVCKLLPYLPLTTRCPFDIIVIMVE
jgi:hypothetical protein